MKITGATTHGLPLVPVSNLSNEFVFPEACTSLSLNEVMPPMDEIVPISVSPVLKGDDMEPQDELDFDEFLLDAAEWL